jgi:Domain of unknown function (DUF4465)/Secretion system C-terminal sorting domain
MKNNYLKSIFAVCGIALSVSLTAQTISTAENITLANESYWNGSDQSGGVSSGNAFFPNTYDSAFAYWSSGWAVSNRTDSAVVASSSAQLYTAATGSGYQSTNYFVGQQFSIIRLSGTAAGGVVNGMYVTNSAFAYNSMTFGDAFAKQFGGASGNDPDWFKLLIRKYDNGQLSADSVEFYLADYRFTNNAQDYIVRNWTWVDLTSLGNCDSIEIEVLSSDVGSFGINTPTFYCIDNFTTQDAPQSIAETAQTAISVWPNPFAEQVTIARSSNTAGTVSVSDAAGRVVYTQPLLAAQQTIDLSFLGSGMYVLSVTEESQTHVQQVIKH